MRIVTALWFLSVALVSSPVWAADEAETRAKTINPYVEDTTNLVLRVDLPRLLAAMEGHDQVVPQIAPGLSTLRAIHAAGGKEAYAVLSLTGQAGGPGSVEPPVLIIPLAPGGNDQALIAALPTQLGREQLTAARFGDHIVCGSPRILERMSHAKPQDRPKLAKAMSAAADSDAQLLFCHTPASRQLLEKAWPTLPIGGGPVTPLSRDCDWVAVGMRFNPEAALSVTIQATNETSAKSLADAFDRVKQALTEMRIPRWEEVQGALVPKLVGDRLVLGIDNKTQAIDKLKTIFIEPALQMQRAVAERTQVGANLSMIALAMLAYAQQTGTLPARAILDKDGKPLLSWRVTLLQGLGQIELYKEFHRDEPWDSEHNLKLLERMPDIYKSPGRPNSTKTAYLAVAGSGTIFAGPKSLGVSYLTDGAANTVLVVEVRADRAVPWTKPDDLEIDLQNPLAAVTDSRPMGFMAVFVDRSTYFIPNTIDPKVFAAACTVSGKETPWRESWDAFNNGR